MTGFSLCDYTSIPDNFHLFLFLELCLKIDLCLKLILSSCGLGRFGVVLLFDSLLLVSQASFWNSVKLL